MSYNISVIQGKPSYESLPALKLISFPKGNGYKPFTQVKPATDGEKLFIEFLVFEAHPPKGSVVCAVFKKNGKELFVECGVKSCSCTIRKNDGQTVLGENLITSHHFDGEDLQGIYWGVDVSLPLDLIFEDEINADSFIMGNFYKYSKEDNPHNGSLYPAAFSKDFLSEDNIGRLDFITY